MPDIFSSEELNTAEEYVDRMMQVGVKKINENGKFTCVYCKSHEVADMQIHNINGRVWYNLKCKQCERWNKDAKP